jgi:hypothetical protein
LIRVLRRFKNDQTAAYTARKAKDDDDYWNAQIASAQDDLNTATKQLHQDRVALNSATHEYGVTVAQLRSAEQASTNARAAQQQVEGQWWSWVWGIFHPRVKTELDNAVQSADTLLSQAADAAGNDRATLDASKQAFAADVATVATDGKQLAKARNRSDF